MSLFNRSTLHKFSAIVAVTLLVLSYLPVSAHAPTEAHPAPPSIPPVQTPPLPSGFLSAPAAGDPVEIALRYLREHRFELKLTDQDLSDIVVKDRYVTAHNGVTHLYLRQRLNGIEVFNGDVNVNLTPDGRIINLGNHFVSDLQHQVDTTAPTLTPIDAVTLVAPQLGLIISEALVATSSARGADRAVELSGGGISSDPIPLRLIYQPLSGGHVHLAWNMVLRLKTSPDLLDIRADAMSGAILSKVNLTKDGKAMGHPLSAVQGPVQAANAAPNAPSAPNSYLVYALPAENPFNNSATLVTDPADAVASPFGWHDTDGAPGPEYTTPRGNNAFAYDDLVAPDGFGAGDVTTDGGPGVVFSAAADFNQPPSTYRAASLTNLFYVTNKAHDIMYFYGFDEASGNFQTNNYGRGGLAGDAVNAEGQDYGGVNNANFSTPVDGQQPRMQMYLGNLSTKVLVINAPANISGTYSVGSPSFGPSALNTTGDVILVNDGSIIDGGTINDGCQTPFVNAAAISGKIVLIDRGKCTFKAKVKNAETNGAIAVIIVNNQAGGAPSMGDDGTIPAVLIPSLSIAQSDGGAIKAQLAMPVTVNATLLSGPQRDGSFDNGVILHEYGHGVSTRLTGGPSNSSCLDAQESGGMGEGWSDFLALVLTAHPGDTATTLHTVGNWLNGNTATGSGFRTYPYTTDMAVNPHTFDDTKLNDEVHAVGEVWTTILWEVYWNMVTDHGFNPDLYHGTGGNNLALQLVMDGMKLQTCNPTFVDARDAILTADRIDNNGANQCRIWEGFAKRGLGYSATAGDSSSATDGEQAFDLPPVCMVNVQPPSFDICIPASANFDIALGKSFNGAATLSVNGIPSGTTANFTPNPVAPPNHSTLTLANTNAALPGSYAFQVMGTGSSQVYTTPVTLHLASGAPSAPVLTAVANGATNVTERPTLQWQAATQATDYLLELSEGADFSSLVYTTTVQTTSVQIPYYLRSGHTYYWRVTAHNGCSNVASDVAHFTVRVFPRVLLVDDDANTSGGDNVTSYYEDALTTLNVPYDVWDTGDGGNLEPTQLDQITDYSTIVWFDGPVGANALPTTEPLLGTFLDQGKCFFISAQDYYITNGLTPFMQNYLGVAAALDDKSDGNSWHTVVTGAGPIFGGLGPYTLSFPPLGNYTDLITPTVSAGLAFAGDAGNAAVYKDGGNYRTTYWGFGLETLPTANDRAAALQRVLQWCDFQTDTGIAQQVAPSTTVRPGQPITYTLTYSNTGIKLAEPALITATLPPALTDLHVISAGVAITPLVNSSYIWQTANITPGQVGTITVTGIVSPALSADALLTFQASMSRQAADTQLANNNSQPQAINAVVPRLRLANANPSVSEERGSLTIVAQLDQANPYGAVQANYATSDGSAQAGSDYAASSGTLTIPAGALTTTFTIPLLDDAVAEPTETILVNLSQPAGATLDTPATATVSIIDTDVAPPSVPDLQLAFAAQPGDSSTIHVGDRITYSIALTNTGDVVNHVTVSVTLPAATILDPTSVTPPTTALAANTLAAANVSLVWQLASLATNATFHASFAVGVNQAGPLNLAVQAGVAGAPPLVSESVGHQVTPTGSSQRLYLPMIRR